MLHKRKTPESIQKVWVTPSIKVMSTPSDEAQAEYYNGTEIAKVITACGVSCELVKQVVAPQVATYHSEEHHRRAGGGADGGRPEGHRRRQLRPQCL